MQLQIPWNTGFVSHEGLSGIDKQSRHQLSWKHASVSAQQPFEMH